VKFAFPARIIGALLALTLAGCSTLRTAYDNAPTLLYWWLDGYVDFDDSQKPLVRDSLARLHAWHRQQELPAWIELLQRMQQLGGGAISPELACHLAGQLRARLLALAPPVAEGLARVAPTLQAPQLRRLADRLEENNQNWRQQWLDGSPAQLLQRRLERAVERYEDFYGSLSDAQKDLLRQQLAGSGFDARIAWAERLRRQQDLLRVLQEHRGSDRAAHIQAEMLALLQRSFVQSPDAQYQRQFDRVWQSACATLAAVHNSASAAQRRHLLAQLRGYEDDLRALMRQGR
jgi:hypothetical protein